MIYTLIFSDINLTSSAFLCFMIYFFHHFILTISTLLCFRYVSCKQLRLCFILFSLNIYLPPNYSISSVYIQHKTYFCVFIFTNFLLEKLSAHHHFVPSHTHTYLLSISRDKNMLPKVIRR